MMSLEVRLSSTPSSVTEEKRVWVAFDQSGTYRTSVINARRMHQPLDEAFAEYLYDLIIEEDLDRLGKIASDSTVIFKNLPVQINTTPSGDDPKEAEFKFGITGSQVRSEQEAGLLKLAQNPNIGCTMISAMPVEGAPWAWFGLGEIGRASVHQDRQMILRRGPNPFVSKLSELMIIKYGLDRPDNERSQSGKVFWVDDDLNLACLISRFLQIPVLVPINAGEDLNVSKLPIPKVLQDEYEEVYVGSGLPELGQFLSECLTERIPDNRFDAYRSHFGNAVELSGSLSLEDFRNIPSSKRAY